MQTCLPNRLSSYSKERKYNVTAYNYSDDVWASGCGGLPWDGGCGDIQIHGDGSTTNGNNPGPTRNLFEGNIVEKVVIDSQLSDNGPYNTFFRCSAHNSPNGLGIETKVEHNNHYRQNVVAFHGECGDPYFSPACGKLEDYGHNEFWEDSPDFLQNLCEVARHRLRQWHTASQSRIDMMMPVDK